MVKATKTTMVAGAAIVALVGIGGGVAFATSGSTTSNSTPIAATAASATVGGTTPTTAAKARGRKGRQLLARAEHAVLTVRTPTGTEVVDLQRGQVTSVSPTSITVRSADGFSATYVVTSTTKVDKGTKAIAIGNVANGDKVQVTALHSGNTDTAQRIGDAVTTAAGH